MACLHAITGSRWRPTVRIAGKNILGFGKIGAALSAPGQRAFVVEPRDRPMISPQLRSRAQAVKL
jgi:hypothetical protein